MKASRAFGPRRLHTDPDNIVFASAAGLAHPPLVLGPSDPGTWGGGGGGADTAKYLSNVRVSDSLSNVETVDKNTGRIQRIEGARDSSD